MKLKIVQIVTHLNLHDAIGNDVLAMDEALKQQGYDSRIMAYNIHDALKDKVEPLDFSALSPEDLVIFHKATGDRVTGKIAGLPCKKVMVYHNITPAKYLLPYDPAMFLILSLGRLQLRRHASRMDACWAVSQYNAKELQRYKVQKEKLAVLPILFSKEERTIQPDPKTQQKLRANQGTKLLYIGRITPNKKPEDVIKAYQTYKDRYDKNATLYLLGSWDGMEKYYAKLKGFAADLNLTDEQVVFAGRVTDEEREAYLRNSDILLCLSEHEGFCVPLLEAASRSLPVLAYVAAAIPETLGDSGLLFQTKDYDAMADAIYKLQTDEAFRKHLIRSQQNNMKRFDRVSTEQQFLRLVAQITGQPETKDVTYNYPDCTTGNEFHSSEKSIPAHHSGISSGFFKPLWMIHNQTYQQYAKGSTRKRLKATLSKVLKMFK